MRGFLQRQYPGVPFTICVYVHVCVCLCVCVYRSLHVRIHACAWACVQEHVCAWVCVHEHACVRVYVCALWIHVCTWASIYMCVHERVMHRCVHMSMYVCTWAWICMYVCTWACMCACVCVWKLCEQLQILSVSWVLPLLQVLPPGFIPTSCSKMLKRIGTGAEFWVLILSLPHRAVILGSCFSFSVLQFSHP